jgi:uncharacterized protein
MKSFVTFIVLACLLSWLFWLPLYGPALGVRGLPVLPLHHAMGSLGPMVAAFLFVWFKKGSKGLKSLFIRMTDARSKAFLLIALAGPFLLLFLAALIDFFVSGTAFSVEGMGKTNEFSTSVPVYFLYNLLFFGFGEEAGWAGVAIPELQKHCNAFAAAAIFTCCWGLWHWPLFLYRPGMSSMGLAEIIGWLLSLFTGRLLLGWILNSTRGSILICAVFHAAIDVAFVSDFTTPDRSNYLGILITVWGVAVVLVCGAKNLSGRTRFTA